MYYNEKLKVRELKNLFIGAKSKRRFPGDNSPLINEKLILKTVSKKYIIGTVFFSIFAILCSWLFILTKYSYFVIFFTFISILLLYNVIKLRNYIKTAKYAFNKKKVKIRRLNVSSTYIYYHDMGDGGPTLYYIVLGSGETKCQAEINQGLFSRVFDNDSFYVISLTSPHGFINLLFCELDYHIQEEFGQRYKFIKDDVSDSKSNNRKNNEDEFKKIHQELVQSYVNSLKHNFKKYIFILCFIAILIILYIFIAET